MNSIEKTENYILQTYSRTGAPLVKGKGAILIDESGKEFLDFLSGIAVCNLGHCHPKITKAIADQAENLVHVSNLFYSIPQADLATMLTENCFADQVFFANSGAEANEAAIKLARRYFQAKGEENRFYIITMEKSFHGRTMAALSATGQDKIKTGFKPLLEGFYHVPFNDIDALAARMNNNVCAVMLEPVQGEGGVIPADYEYLTKVRELCTQKGILLIFDEIQTGMGRCGTLFAHQGYQVEPDIMTLAKALANGVPMGAMLATKEAANGFELGSHGSTFGGSPLAAAAACQTLTLIKDPDFLIQVREKGQYLYEKLEKLGKKYPQKVQNVRGKGLLLGMELDRSAEAVVSYCHKNGFIINGIQDKVLRFAPPLIIEQDQMDQLIEVMDAALANIS